MMDKDDPGLLMRHRLKVHKSPFGRRLQHCPTKCLVDDMGNNVLNLKYIRVKWSWIALYDIIVYLAKGLVVNINQVL